MMKRLFSMLICLTMTCAMYAVKANSEPVTVTQKDGSQLTVRLFGDENYSWSQTLDGVLLYQDGTDYYVASIDSEGLLRPTTQLAHESSMRLQAEMQLVAAQNKTLFYAHATAELQRGQRRAANSTNSTHFPHTGTPKGIVILADFADQKFSHDDATTRLIFDQYLNADGVPATGNPDIDSTSGESLSRNKGSVKKYFSDMSGSTFEPQFDVYGPVHLTENLKHYGEGRNDHMNLFIPDVCAAIDEELDFSQYDANNDGKVDLVYIIYAGYSASLSGNSTDCIWPKSGAGTWGTYDGVEVYRFGVNNELNGTPASAALHGSVMINGIGLFCHEFSHCMGMPDLYPTVADAQVDNQAMEDFSVMDGGSYCRNGYCPTAYTAWERETMGWMEIETLTDPVVIRNLPSLENGGKAYRILNDADETGLECYILENIQRGGWNNYIGSGSGYAHGLMITHAEYSGSNLGNLTSPNNVKGHPRMTVLPASGRLVSSYKDGEYRSYLAACLFPNTEPTMDFLYAIDGYTNMIVYNGDVEDMAAEKPVLDIQEDTETNTVTFTFIKDPDIEAVEAVKVAENGKQDAYNLAGQRISLSGEMPHGLYIVNGVKIMK